MDLQLQCNRNYGHFFLVLFIAMVGFCCSPETALASRGVIFSWEGDTTAELEGYRLYYGKESRFEMNQPEFEEYDYFLDLTAMARCSTNRSRPGCQTMDTDNISCSDLESATPKCVIKGLPGGLNYFAITAYSNTIESGYSTEITGVLDRKGNLIGLRPVPARSYAHLKATYDLLLR